MNNNVAVVQYFSAFLAIPTRQFVVEITSTLYFFFNHSSIVTIITVIHLKIEFLYFSCEHLEILFSMLENLNPVLHVPVKPRLNRLGLNINNFEWDGQRQLIDKAEIFGEFYFILILIVSLIFLFLSMDEILILVFTIERSQVRCP